MTQSDRSKRNREKLMSTLAWFAAPAVVALPGIEWLPGIPDDIRPVLVTIFVVLGLVGLWASLQIKRKYRATARDLAELRKVFDPGHAIDYITNDLFASGAWRLTVYRKQRSKGSGSELQRLWSQSSDRDHSETAPEKILLKPSLFAESFDENLANPQRWQANQSGSFDESVSDGSWMRWRNGIFGGEDATPANRSVLFTRKFAWFAVQDPDSRAVVAVLAESTSPTGINFDVLNDSATPVWLLLIARLSAGASLVPGPEEQA